MEKELPMEQWVMTVPSELRADPLWKSAYYRLAMYLYDLAWMDAEILHKDYRAREIVSQIVRSAGSICANMEEAYGRGIGSADYVRIMRISLGEVRETQGWYFRSRHVLSAETLQQRSSVLVQIISLLVTAIDGTRKSLRAHRPS